MAASFNDVLRAAVADLAEHGYDDRERVDAWLVKLRAAAAAALVSEHELNQRLGRSLGKQFRKHMRMVGKRHRGIDRFTIANIQPALRNDLDRRILASVKLIRLNREASIQKTLQRFEGWSTAIPRGGSRTVDRGEAVSDIGKAVRGIPFEERRVAIDQGHKLLASIDATIATAGEAIAAIWHSHWRETGYDYRPAHKRLDGGVFLLRKSWAAKAGLVKKPGDKQYSDQVMQPAVEPFCRCYWQYLYALADLPEEYLTAKGKLALKGERRAVNS